MNYHAENSLFLVYARSAKILYLHHHPRMNKMKITEKEFNAQMDRMNGEEPEEEELTVIIDEIYLMRLQSEITSMRGALEEIANLIDYTTPNDFTDYPKTAKSAVRIARNTLDKW
jgi:hypothetical protein